METREQTKMIRILVVDDQSSIRRGLRMRLGLEADMEVVGEAADGEAALKMTHLLAPNVVVMDVQMPIMDGIAATAELHRSDHHPAVVMLSLYDDARTRKLASEAGADAFVPKDCMTECLSDAIRSASAGHAAAHASGMMR